MRPLGTDSLFGLRPTTTSGWTAETGTNMTEDAFTATGLGTAGGLALFASSATVSSRLTHRYQAGTVMSGILFGHGTPAATGYTGGPCLTLRRSSDARVVMLGIGLVSGVPTLRVHRWTDKDTFGAVLLDAALYGWPRACRIADEGGNVVVKIGDGTTWATLYSAADATAWGSAGAADQIGFGVFSVANSAKLAAFLDRLGTT